MGLDMYARRRHDVEKWDHQPTDEQYNVRLTRGGKPVKRIKTDRITSVEEDTMYWRKANHIHAWFVKNVQYGKDDCQEYLIGTDQLQELYDLCDQVIAASKLVDGLVDAGTVYDKDHPQGVVQRTPGKVIEDPTVAKKLLPTRSGFFFGCEDYDEWYLKDVKDTRDWAARLLADFEHGVSGDNFYSSSW